MNNSMAERTRDTGRRDVTQKLIYLAQVSITFFFFFLLQPVQVDEDKHTPTNNDYYTINRYIFISKVRLRNGRVDITIDNQYHTF